MNSWSHAYIYQGDLDMEAGYLPLLEASAGLRMEDVCFIVSSVVDFGERWGRFWHVLYMVWG